MEGQKEGGRKVRQGGKRKEGKKEREKQASWPPVYSQGTDIVLSLGSPLVVMYILTVLVRVLQRGEQGAYIKRDNIPYNKNKRISSHDYRESKIHKVGRQAVGPQRTMPSALV